MQHAAPLTAPRESVFAVVASSARKLSDRELSVIAVASGSLALAAAALGRASWILLAGCYVVWCFAGWGILFRASARRSLLWRSLEWIIAASATVVFVVLGIGVFFWALGSHWQL